MKESTSMLVVKALELIAAVIALIVASTIWAGYVTSVLWGWFVVPTFGVPALSLAAAIGLAMTVRLITYQYDAKNGKTESTMEAVIYSALLPLGALSLGWVVHQFM